MDISPQLDTIMTGFTNGLFEQSTVVIPGAIEEMFFDSKAFLYLIVFVSCFLLVSVVVSIITSKPSNNLTSSFTPGRH